MLDIQFIRDNKEKVKKAALDKQMTVDIEYLLELDKKRRVLKQEVDELRQKRNEISSRMKGGNVDKKLVKNGKEIKKLLSSLESKFVKVKEEYERLMLLVPQIPSDDTPVGKGEDDNVVVDEAGEKPAFDFAPKDHIELGKNLDILDLERGANVGGYRGYYYKNEGVMLVLGLMMYALEKMTAKGFTPMIPPTLVKEFTLRGSGYFEGHTYNPDVDNIFRVASSKKDQDGKITKDSLFLTGTAEPSLLAYHANETLDEEQLPLKYCGYSQCYRSEIGSYGRDTKGHYRVHEFIKTEQVVLTTADKNEANAMQQEMMDITKEIYDELGFHYRTLLMCTGEMSAGKYKYYDIEVWTPGLDRWSETASASNFLDWQARRLNVKYKDKDGNRKFVYMINNTVLPSPRILIAILENFQQKDGSVKVPDVLQKWVGKDVISRKL